VASSGLEFTDAGFGLGDRENPEVKNLIKRSPGIWPQSALATLAA